MCREGKEIAPNADAWTGAGEAAISRLSSLFGFPDRKPDAESVQQELMEAWLESQRTGIPLETGFDREWVIAALIRASSLRLLEFDTSMGLRVPLADGHALFLSTGYESPDLGSGDESPEEPVNTGPST